MKQVFYSVDYTVTFSKVMQLIFTEIKSNPDLLHPGIKVSNETSGGVFTKLNDIPGIYCISFIEGIPNFLCYKLIKVLPINFCKYCKR